MVTQVMASRPIPMGVSITQELPQDPTGGPRWRKLARVLHQYLRREMKDARDERKRLYPKTHADHVLRPLPFIWRVSRELATLYLRDPDRAFSTLAGPVDDATQNAIRRVYSGAQVNKRLRTCHEHLIAMNNATLWVWPRNDGAGGLRLLAVPCYDQAVELKPGLLHSSDELDVETWWVRMPVRRDILTEQVEYGVARITATEAVWEAGPSDVRGKGVFEAGSTRNPIGRIPVVVLRGTDPAPGEFWAPLPEDLLDGQRAINNDVTDYGEVARRQGFGQAVIKTMANMDEKLEVGAEQVVHLPNEGDSFTFESPGADLQGMGGQVDSLQRSLVAHTGLNPAVFTKSAGITALAKQMEILDRDAERMRHALEFQDAETRLYQIGRLWMNSNGNEVWPSADVTVTYRVAEPPADPQIAATAGETRYRTGQSSAARDRARWEGISLEEAQRRVIEDRTLTAQADAIGMSNG